MEVGRRHSVVRFLLVLLAVALVGAGCASDVTTETTGPGPAGRSTAVPGWEALPEPPIGPRDGAAIAWTGEEIVVFGGTTFLCPPNAGCLAPSEPPLTDGAAYEPASGSWRTIADAPIPVSDAPTARLDGDVYALVTPWTGERRDPSTILLRYRASEEEWRSWDVPVDAPVSGIVATADALVVYPGSDARNEVPDLMFDPVEGSWSEVAADPLSPSFDRRYVWDGRALYLFAKDVTPSPGGESGPALVTAARLDDSGWSRLPTADAIGFWSVIVDDDRLVSPRLGCADGGDTNGYGRCIPYGAVFDTDSLTWSELPDAPGRGQRDAASAGAVTAESVLLFGLGHPMLDLRTDTWFELPHIDEEPEDGTVVQRTIAGAGPYGFAFGGARFGPDDPGGVLLGGAWLWSPPAGS